MTDKLDPEELWEMVKTFSQRATELERLFAIAQGQIAELNTENSKWLEIYRQQQVQIHEQQVSISQHQSQIQGQQSQIHELKAAISRLESLIRAQQAES